jgi:uncharacterized protein YcgL (UPF0745 family)
VTTLSKVYRSGKRADTYLYLACDREFDDLPAEFRQAFGEPVFVMNLQLRPDRPLARVPVMRVIEALEDQGYFVQLPPELPIEDEISRRFS